MGLRFYNTLTRKVEEFAPLDGKTVQMYVCGPTVYDDPHIGHARSAYIFDVLRRYLEHKGFAVTFVRNVTDVDDKIIEKARHELVHSPQSTVHGALKIVCAEVAEKYLKSYHETMERLGIGRPTHEPLATGHLDEMLNLMSQLVLNGSAYETKTGDVYFAVRKFPGYGKLSNRSIDELQAGTRVEPGEQKHDPLDFALWKAAKPDEPAWSSPWGKGRPGWHIECSAMSTKYLGDEFDIHGGGVDLVFPHHENEIAQAQAAGKPFAKYWVHNGLLTVNGEKMSKSLGNYLTVEQVLKDYPHPDYLKLFFLKTHYRSPIDYSPAKIDEVKKNRQEFSRFIQQMNQRDSKRVSGKNPVSAEVEAKRVECREAMDDDLNTPRALAVLFDLANLGQSALAKGASNLATAISVRDALLECGAVLGLSLNEVIYETKTATLPASVTVVPNEAQIEERIQQRNEARKKGDFKKADEIRKALLEVGVVLTDTTEGTLWHRAE